MPQNYRFIFVKGRRWSKYCFAQFSNHSFHREITPFSCNDRKQLRIDTTLINLNLDRISEEGEAKSKVTYKANEFRYTHGGVGVIVICLSDRMVDITFVFSIALLQFMRTTINRNEFDIKMHIQIN